MKDKEELKILNGKAKAENNILQFHLERLQSHYLCLEKCFISWWTLGQGMQNDYILDAYLSQLPERYTWETANTVDNFLTRVKRQHQCLKKRKLDLE